MFVNLEKVVYIVKTQFQTLVLNLYVLVYVHMLKYICKHVSLNVLT